jgi:hypothetical protein
MKSERAECAVVPEGAETTEGEIRARLLEDDSVCSVSPVIRRTSSEARVPIVSPWYPNAAPGRHHGS